MTIPDPKSIVDGLADLVLNKKCKHSDFAFLNSIYKKHLRGCLLTQAHLNAVLRFLPKENVITEPEQVFYSPTLIISNQCNLRNADPKIVKQIKTALTINNPKYIEATKYGRWIGKDLTEKLYFFREGKNNIRFPKGFLEDFLELSPDIKIVDKRKKYSNINFKFVGKLRKYQKRAIKDVLKHNEGILESGTGSGKTVMAIGIIAKRKQPTLILVHTKELLYQWQQRVKTFLGVDAGLVGDGIFVIKPITVAIVNTAKNNLTKLKNSFGQICIDECHRTPSTMFTQVVTSFNCKYVLGLSATAYRRDGLTKLIHLYVGPVRHKIKLKSLEECGAVLKPVFVQQKTQFQFQYKDNYSAMISALTKDESRNKQICEDIVTQIKHQSGIILVVSDRVPHCLIFRDYLVEAGISTALLVGNTKNDDRARIVKMAQHGKIQVLISTMQLIGEGFDCAGLDSLFITTPISYKGRLKQIVGRILRPKDGKRATVFDYRDPVGILERSADVRLQLYK